MKETPIKTFVGKLKMMELYSDHVEIKALEARDGNDGKHIIFYDQITKIVCIKASSGLFASKGFMGLGRLVIERHGDHNPIKSLLSMNTVEFVKSQYSESLEVKEEIQRLMIEYRRNLHS